MTTIKNYRKSAFTLLELAVVLIIVALIAGIGLSSSKDAIDSANQVATQNRLDTIEKALFTFWQKNGRLPCPADATLATSNASYGVEGSCASANFTSATNLYKAAEGAVPIVTLGLPKDFIYDGWKRKIAYAVKPEYAAAYARERIPVKSSSCVADTAIRIKDAGGSDRSISAMYALISYGKNGHGGYPIAGSTRYNAGSTNADELINCHCNASGVNTTYDGNYVQRNQNLNSGTAANYFDDIVRYKERWQMSTPEDIANDDGYRGPDVVVGYEKAATGTFYTYKNQCGAFVKQAVLNPLPTNIPRGVAFTTGNKHLLTYSGAGCNLYKINQNGTLTNLPSAFVTNLGVAAPCPYNATAVMTLSNNGYLAISTSTASAVIHLWKQAGDKFIQLSDLTHSAASVAEVSFTLDAKLLAVRSATTTSKIYKRRGDSFSSAAADITQPVGLNTFFAPLNLGLSPDGRYLYGYNREASSYKYLNIWRITYGKPVSFVTIPKFISTWGGTSVRPSFSPDGRYMVMGMGGWIGLCKIDPGDIFCGGTKSFSGQTLAKYNIWATLSTFMSSLDYNSASKDTNYIVSTVLDGSVALIRKNSVSSFSDISAPFQSDGTVGATPVRAFDQVLSGSAGGPVAFSH
ncbi:MAG: prepilin-type N-terminal cleavage/methylation domain-containing protein [Rickettsiales bacterium]